MSVDTLELGREAIRRHAWMEALEAFATVDRAEGLAAEDLELQGEAAWWSGRPDAATEALERAFTLHVEAQRPVLARLLVQPLERVGAADTGTMA